MAPRCASGWYRITTQLCKLPVGLCKLPVKLTMLEGLKGQQGFLMGSVQQKHQGISRQVGLSASAALVCVENVLSL